MPDLAFYTTEELIEELLSRHTFLGVVVHSTEEHRGTQWQGEKQFQVHFNDNLSPPEAGASWRPSRIIWTCTASVDLIDGRAGLHDGRAGRE